MSNDTDTKVHGAKPAVFDGSKAKYASWRRQIILYIAEKKDRFTTDEAKILFVLSYMKEGFADKWAQNYLEAKIDDVGEVTIIDTWKDFLEALDKTFKDANFRLNAQTRLEALKQGSHTADEYFVEFEQLMVQAGFKTGGDHEQYLISRIEQGLNYRLVERVYDSDSLPASYEDYKDKVINIDNMQRRLQSRLKSGPLVVKPNTTASTNMGRFTRTEGHSTGVPVRRDGTGVTFGGHGQPMEVDRVKKEKLCYGCGQPGHFRRNCPMKPQVVRQVKQADIPQVDLAAMAKELTWTQISDLVRSKMPENPTQKDLDFWNESQ